MVDVGCVVQAMSADSKGRPWDWSDDADDVIVPEQPAVACYTNPAGDVVLRQRGAWNDDEDAWIWFSPEHARAIATAILQVAGYEATARAPVPKSAQNGSKPKDPTGAARQRRRRERQKEPTLDIDRDQARDVTAEDRDTVTVAVTRDGEAS